MLGEDAMYKYSPRELFEKLEEMSTSHEEYTNLQECNDAKEAHELFNPVVCDIWLLQTGDTTATSSQSTKNMYESFKLQRKELNN